MRKVHVNIVVRAIIRADEGVSISEVINEMDYSLKSNTDGADIEDTEIQDYEVTDSE